MKSTLVSLTQDQGKLSAQTDINIKRSVSLVLLLVPGVGDHDTAGDNFRHR